MSRKTTGSKSPRQLLLDINRLIEQLERDRDAALRDVSHAARIGPAKFGRATTILGACADDCPACEVDARFAKLGMQIGRIQREALRLNGQASLRSAAALEEGRRKKAAKQKSAITPRKYASALKRAKHGSQKELASLLRVSPPTLRKFQRGTVPKK